MTPREAYKAGFLARCADEGLTPEAIARRIKAAWINPLDVVTGGVKNLTGAAKNVVGMVKDVGVPAAVGLGGGALGVGFLGGSLAGHAQSDPLGAEETKAQDLIAQYKLLQLQAEREAARRQRAGEGVRR